MIKTNIRDSYALYKKSTDNPVSLKDYVKLTGLFNKFLIDITLEGHKVTLPSRFGFLEVTGRKQKPRLDEEGNIKGLVPDWQKTKKLWEKDSKAKEEKTLVYHSNAHTGKMIYKFHWSKRNVLIKNKLLYSLKMTRANKRALSARIKNGKEY